MGVVLFADFWVLPRMGIPSEMAATRGMKETTNLPAVVAWFVSVVVTLPIAILTVLEYFFTPVLTIILAFAIYVGLSKAMRQDTVDEVTRQDTLSKTTEDPAVELSTADGEPELEQIDLEEP